MSNRKWKKWTDAEIKRLIKYWESGIKVKEIQRVFSKTRTASAVSIRIHELQRAGKIKNRNVLKDKALKKSKKYKQSNWNTPYTPEWVKAGKQAMMGQPPSKTQSVVASNTPHKNIRLKCDEIKKMLQTKNTQYGDSALNPIRVFSKADATEQLKVRIDDKLSRLVRGNDSIESDEDVVRDLIGYLVLLLIQYDTQS